VGFGELFGGDVVGFFEVGEALAQGDFDGFFDDKAGELGCILDPPPAAGAVFEPKTPATRFFSSSVMERSKMWPRTSTLTSSLKS